MGNKLNANLDILDSYRTLQKYIVEQYYVFKGIFEQNIYKIKRGKGY